ncbi:cation channel family protein (macronuclear) [Tetrahymena thermophila SB210]|uniref:Cation channel family protein n=1 Tax=Tetrahymena thermophila (strain SB210) TaxID=312017 RepID=W7XGM7_TETTS|nr:cation channel family protein [Tetrahymena thermophila SB210]EWS73306.1 cation channel family protein [Tetrahymena thermophila SB210]|eukprot:XP_012654155.1 cation channel family protein [Tetrahymena thermophila SB210]
MNMTEHEIISTLKEVSQPSNFYHENSIQLNLSSQRQENQYEIQNEGAINRRKIFQRDQQIQKDNFKKDFRSISVQDEQPSLSVQQSFLIDPETIQRFDEAQDQQKQNLNYLIANLEDINIQTDNFTLESQFVQKNVTESVFTHQIYEDDSKQSCNQKPQHTLSNISRPRKTTIFYDFQQIKSKKYEENSQISQKIQRINEHFRFYNRFPITYELVQLVSMLLIIAHLFGCGFYYIGDNLQGSYINQQRQTNWVEANNLKDQDLFTKYLTTLYYCVITMITVGYGDITPISIYEKAYVIGMALISCGVFAYSVNTVGNIFSKLREQNVSYQKEQFELINYMEFRNIKKQTQMKILKYLEYIKKGKDENKYQAMEILSQFPQNLREEVQREYFYKILKGDSFLAKQFSEKFLIQLSLKMKEKTYGPWEKLVSRGSLIDNLYFIIKGQIAYSSDNRENNKFIVDIPFNITMIDFRLFASRKIPHISVSCKSVTQVASISYSDFVEIIKQHALDYEKFCFLKDQYLNDRRYDYPCLSCSFYGHSITDCPQLHYKIESSQYFYKKTLPSTQIRQNFQRLEKKSLNSIIYKALISKCLKSLRLQKLSEKYESFKNIKILDEIEKYEDDKLFFFNFPKIIQNKYLRKKSVTSKSQYSQSKSEGNELDETSECSYDNTETQVKFPSVLSQEKIIQMQKSQYNNINIPSHDNNYSESLIPQIFNNANIRLQDSIELSNMNLKDAHFELREQAISEIQEKETETVNNTMTYTENNNKITSSTIISNDPYLQIIVNQNQNTNASKSAFQNEANEEKFQGQYTEIKRRKVSRDSSLNFQTVQKQIKHDILESMKQMQDLLVSLINDRNKKKRFTKNKFSINIQNQRKNALLSSPNIVPQQEDIDEEQLTQFFKNNVAFNKDIPENDNQIFQNIHLLGKLNFKFDQMKEFQIYYPKNNFGNVIKAYKKIQNQKYTKHKVKRNKANTEFNTPQNQQQNDIFKKIQNLDQNSNITKN